jgi:hypothetical protein
MSIIYENSHSVHVQFSFVSPLHHAAGSLTLNSNNSAKKILGYDSGTQVGPFCEKAAVKNFTLLSV